MEWGKYLKIMNLTRSLFSQYIRRATATTNSTILKWAKDMNGHFFKDTQMASKHMKNGQHHYSSGKCRSKAKWNIIAYLLK